MTKVSKDPLTGQLSFQKEVFQSKVFGERFFLFENDLKDDEEEDGDGNLVIPLIFIFICIHGCLYEKYYGCLFVCMRNTMVVCLFV